jgi:hypothetical protein
VDRFEIGFLEISVYPERICVDNGYFVLPDIGVVAELRQEVGDPAVDRRANLGALEIDPGLLQIGHRLLILGIRGDCVARVGFLLLGRNGELSRINSLLASFSKSARRIRAKFCLRQ